MKTLKVISVNISEKKGVVKKPVPEIQLYEEGVKGDAHSGNWQRQVSLLGIESFKRFEKIAQRKLEYGEFAENITTEGLELFETHPLDHLTCGDIDLQITQIGKECHGDRCAIYSQVGKCVMPKEGIFARVIRGGTMKAGDEIIYKPYTYKTLVITLSDRAHRGEYKDRSGPKVKYLLEDYFKDEGFSYQIDTAVIPDEAKALELLLQTAREEQTDFIFTTGGTGIGPRDITVDVVSSMLDKQVPGIMELIRVKYGQQHPNALISRGVAGVMNKTLVFTLPGSVRAVQDYMNEILKLLYHMKLMLEGIDAH